MYNKQKPVNGTKFLFEMARFLSEKFPEKAKEIQQKIKSSQPYPSPKTFRGRRRGRHTRVNPWAGPRRQRPFYGSSRRPYDLIYSGGGQLGMDAALDGALGRGRGYPTSMPFARPPIMNVGAMQRPLQPSFHDYARSARQGVLGAAPGLVPGMQRRGQRISPLMMAQGTSPSWNYGRPSTLPDYREYRLFPDPVEALQRQYELAEKQRVRSAFTPPPVPWPPAGPPSLLQKAQNAAEAFAQGFQIGPVKVKPHLGVGSVYLKDGQPLEDWAKEKFGEARETVGKVPVLGDRIKALMPEWGAPDEKKPTPPAHAQPEPQAIVGIKKMKEPPAPGTGSPFEPEIVPMSKVKPGQRYIPIGMPPPPPSPMVVGTDPLPLRAPINQFGAQFEMPVGIKESVDQWRRWLRRFGY